MEYQFQRLLIASDLSEMDNKLLAFSKEIALLTDTEQLYLVHIIPDFSNPKNHQLAFHQSFSKGYPVDEKARDILKERVSDHYTTSDYKINIEIIEGNIYQKLLHWTEVKEIDLVVVGRKKIRNGSGIVPRRIARKVNCHVLFVSEDIEDKITSITVPIDFSPNSLLALKKALDFKAKSKTPVSVTALHVVSLLSTDYYFGLEYNEEYREALRSEKEKEFAAFLEKNKISLDSLAIDLVINNTQNIALQIKEYLKSNPTNLVIIGALGHTTLQNFIYGSVTERFVEIYDESPILIIR